jgi:V8-like Glu-specific endopeptidase
MQHIKCFILGLCVVLAGAVGHLRQKRDTKSIINDALNLYYYGQNFKIPTITLNTKATESCGASGLGNAYYLQDIIGQADNVGDVKDCLAGCMNIADCTAINYVANLKQCVALKSGTTEPTNLLIDGELSGSSHYMFKDCKSKTPKPATKPAAGDAPKGCGLPYFQQNLLAGAKTRIIGGTEAIPYSYPWIGRVNYDLGGNMISNCGSSLIMGSSSTESDLVITAAHCVVNEDKSDRNPEKFTLYFGNHDNRFMEQQEVKVGVKKILYHGDYKTKNVADIALLKLKTPVKFNNYIRPICLANAGQLPKDKNSCVAAGWGRIANANSNTPNRLQQIRYPVQDDKTCGDNKIWGASFDSATMTCAGPLDGSVSTCQGDSGGPLACFEDGHWTLYGATSFGNGVTVNKLAQCAAANKPAVFARISGLRDWIDKSIKDINK